MEKVEYSDLYKFLCSIGIILIAISFVFPYLMLKEPLGTLTTIETYSKLTPSAKSIFDRRQDILICVLKNLHFISLATFTTGGLILLYGISKWSKKQKNIDLADDAKIKKELEEMGNPLNNDEVVTKATEEMNEEFSDTSSFTTNTSTTTKDQASFISKYLVVENSILNLIREDVGNHFITFPNYKIGIRVFDAILLERAASRDLRGRGLTQKEYFLEIKYTTHLRDQYIKNVIKYTYLLFTTFKTQSKRTAVPIIIIVVATNKHNSSFIEKVNFQAIKNELTKETSSEYTSLLKHIIVDENQTESIDFKKIIN
ncbi:MAG: hypothetical protein R2800_07705 [Flavipsychrobacter sp.]